MIIFCPDIELTTKRLSFLLQIAVRLRSTSRHKQSALSLWCSYTDGPLTEILSDVFIVFSSCIVERTCGALTVWSTVYFQDMICWSYFPALVFDPDRFLDDRVRKYLTPNPFIFCPFNAGPRICLGQQVYSNSSRNFYKLKKKKSYLRFSVCLSWSDLLPCPPITTVHWIHFGKIWKYSTSGWMGRLWWFEGNGKSIPWCRFNYVY